LAGASLILPYQWRAFWRRVLRTGGVKFYFSVLVMLGWVTGSALPDRLSRAASELAAGQTASMDRLLLVICLLWVVVLSENLNVSLSSNRLRRFPIDVRSLVALKLSSLFLSPIAWLATIASVLALSPLLSARHPLLGSLTALFFVVLTIGVRVTASQLLEVARRRRRLRVAVVAVGGTVLAIALASAHHDSGSLTMSFMAVNPATLVTTIAIGSTWVAMIFPLAALLVTGFIVWWLLSWSFVWSLYEETTERTARRATSIAGFPGRLGPLVQKDLRSLRTVLDLWMGLLLVLMAAALSLSMSLSSTVRQAILVIICALNANVTLNCLGFDRPTGLTRYLILPLRGKDLLLAKNVAMTALLAPQLALLSAIGAWQSGVAQLAADVVVATVLLLAQLAWGNLVSVFEPRRTEPHRFASGGEPVTVMMSVLIGSAPGVAMIVQLRSDSPAAWLSIAAIVVSTMAAYYGSLRYAGSSFERRIEFISRRLM
jgi:hypothetical protein